MNQTVLSGANSSAYQAGYYTAQILVCVLFLGLCLWSLQGLRQADRNRKCAISLALVMGAFLLALVVQFLRKIFPALPTSSHLVFSVSAVGLAVCGVILAIIGIVEYSSNRERFAKGLGQGISALIVGLIFCGLFGVGAVKGFNARRQQTTRLILPNQEVKDTAIRFESLNYEYRPPGQPWKRIDVAKLNPLASVGFVWPEKQVYFQVLVNNKGIDPSATSEELLKLAKKNMTRGGAVPEFGEEVSKEIDGMAGVQLETKFVKGSMRGYSILWVGTAHGYAYQLMCWGPIEEKENIVASAKPLFERFQRLDPEKSAYQNNL